MRHGRMRVRMGKVFDGGLNVEESKVDEHKKCQVSRKPSSLQERDLRDGHVRGKWWEALALSRDPVRAVLRKDDDDDAKELRATQSDDRWRAC